MSEWQEMGLLFKLLLLPMRLFVHASFEFLGLIREKIFFLFSHDLGSLFSFPRYRRFLCLLFMTGKPTTTPYDCGFDVASG